MMQANAKYKALWNSSRVDAGYSSPWRVNMSKTLIGDLGVQPDDPSTLEIAINLTVATALDAELGKMLHGH